MSVKGARWVLVGFTLPNRSKAQRALARSFSRYLVDRGYYPLHDALFIKYVPSRRRAETEKSNLQYVFPEQGSLQVVELSQASANRAILIADGTQATLPKVPELLTLY